MITTMLRKKKFETEHFDIREEEGYREGKEGYSKVFIDIYNICAVFCNAYLMWYVYKS